MRRNLCLGSGGRALVLAGLALCWRRNGKAGTHLSCFGEGWLEPRWSGVVAGVFRAIVDMKKRRREATAALSKKVLGVGLRGRCLA